MNCFIIGFLSIIINEVKSEAIEKKVVEYFESDSDGKFQAEWHKHRKSYENAILLALKEGYGYKGMNIYIKKPEDALTIAKGYYHSDNQVEIVLSDMNLEELPHLWMPEVSLSLASHRLRVSAGLSKMIIHTAYLAFRNRSDIIYGLKNQDPYKNSPFLFEQVQNMGQLTILIDGCILSGMAISTLNGDSVNLGLNTFSLSKCQYTFEIFSPRTGSPPVIAKYLPDGEGLNIEQLLMNTLRQELMPKLQAAMFTYVNTSVIFGKELSNIRRKQSTLFKETSNYVNDVIKKYMKITIERNLESIELNDFNIYWNDTFNGEPQNNGISLTDMVLTGLETAYSAHIGGPYKISGMKITEQIRFSCLQVRGYIKIYGIKVSSHAFVAEIVDVAVDVTIQVNLVQTKENQNEEDKLKPSKAVRKIVILGWRALDISIPDIEFSPAEAIITGYIIKAIPDYVVQHIFQLFHDMINLKASSAEQDETKYNGPSKDYDERSGRSRNKTAHVKLMHQESNQKYASVNTAEDTYWSPEDNRKPKNKVKLEISKPKAKFFSESMLAPNKPSSVEDSEEINQEVEEYEFKSDDQAKIRRQGFAQKLHFKKDTLKAIHTSDNEIKL